MNEPDNVKDDLRMIRRHRRRHRILQATAILPGLATILNGLSGFAAIHFATKLSLGDSRPAAVDNLMIGSGLLFLAMVFDMLDGRLARMTRRTTDFGAQLDSLCDMISFGVAPAVLVSHAAISAIREAIGYQNITLERVVLCVASVYVACAAMRLARFNVENEPDESAHMSFKGLPSPGAAAAAASLVLLQCWLKSDYALTPMRLLIAAGCTTFLSLVCGLLMVSRFRYPHVVNQYIRGKRAFSYLVKMVIVVVAAVIEHHVTMAAVTVGYALSGPIGALWRLWRKPRTHPAST